MINIFNDNLLIGDTNKCDHGLKYESAIVSRTSEEVRKQFPRLDGICPKGCGFKGIGYFSYEHYLAGDW